MVEKLITISESTTSKRAEELFLRYCRFDLSKDRHKDMYKDALKIREKGKDGITIKAIISSFTNDFKNHKISIKENEIYCPAFFQIPQKSAKNVYIFLITAGECICEKDATMADHLYADLWGTAYLDAAREELERMLEAPMTPVSSGEARAKKSCLWGPISPGFYGMPIEENIKICDLLSGEKIGVSANEYGTMTPMKTCSGIYITVADPKCLLTADCKSCMGNLGGCSICKLQDPV